ncbi:MAG TPA: ABC transporter permease [Chloroflexota bacterium]|nr:ABC transporter permease [Chloroflexota bacterium]
MGRYLIRRLLAAIPVMLMVATAVFMLLFLAGGDPASVILGPDARPEQVEDLRVKLGLDQPLHVQVYRWYARLLQGDLGQSIFLNRPVTQAIAERAEPTLILTTLALLVALSIGLPMGILSALRRGQWLDTGAMFVAIGGVSMPTFWLGLNLIFVFGVVLAWLPVAGYESLSKGLWDNLRYMIMPAVTLGMAQGALLARLTRSMMLETLSEDYVRTARAKGLAERRVVAAHALRNAMIPLLTIIGLIFAALMGGAVITEQVFNIPGVGRLLIQAVTRRDYPVVQGVVLVVAGLYVLINLVVDVLYGYLDPRLRYGRA